MSFKPRRFQNFVLIKPDEESSLNVSVNGKPVRGEGKVDSDICEEVLLFRTA
jgi:hypothetical protein